VTLNGTTTSAGFGGVVAAPVFRTVAMEALRAMDVPKDIPDAAPRVGEGEDEDSVNENDTAVAGMSDPPPLDEPEEPPRPRMIGPEPPPVEKPKRVEFSGPRAPNFLGMSMRAVVEEAGAMGLPVSLDGRGVARGQVPAPGSPLPAGAQVRVIFAR